MVLNRNIPICVPLYYYNLLIVILKAIFYLLIKNNYLITFLLIKANLELFKPILNYIYKSFKHNLLGG